MTHGAHAAIIAAEEERKRKLMHEEEEMTTYSTDDINSDWEFKIIRSATNTFRSEEVFAALLEEEAYAGWELVEKLDDQRIRFKRPRSARAKDHRTQYGPSSNVAVIAMVLGLAIALALGIVFFFMPESVDGPIWSLVAVVIPGLLISTGVIAAVAARKRS